jgi:hypothetical protein
MILVLEQRSRTPISSTSISGTLAERRKCERCGNVGKPRQLNELLEFDGREPIIVLCNHCVNLLRYADASTWKWFREFRNREKRQ